MATTVSITGLSKVECGHEVRYTINGVGGKGIVFPSLQGAKDWIAEHALSEEDLLALALRVWFARDPTLTFGNIQGRTLTYDPTISNILRLT